MPFINNFVAYMFKGNSKLIILLFSSIHSHDLAKLVSCLFATQPLTNKVNTQIVDYNLQCAQQFRQLITVHIKLDS